MLVKHTLEEEVGVVVELRGAVRRDFQPEINTTPPPWSDGEHRRLPERAVFNYSFLNRRSAGGKRDSWVIEVSSHRGMREGLHVNPYRKLMYRIYSEAEVPLLRSYCYHGPRLHLVNWLMGLSGLIGYYYLPGIDERRFVM